MNPDTSNQQNQHGAVPLVPPVQPLTTRQVMPTFAERTADPVQVTAPSAAGNPQIADDVDLIEKEWVDKAKQIVEMTVNDPFEQKQEVDRLKADYMQKRYAKTIKSEQA